MHASLPVLICSPVAATLAAGVAGAGLAPVVGVTEGGGGAAIALIDARDDADAACEALARCAAVPVRIALVATIDEAAQQRLVLAGATQIAVVDGDGRGLAPALALAARAAEGAAERRLPAGPPAMAVDAWIDRLIATGQPVTIVYVGLVRLDLVNAAYGREAGTALVAAAERRIAAQVSALADEEGQVARIDGGAFVAAVPGPAEAAIVAAARIEEALARPFRLAGGVGVLGARLGLASSRPGEAAAALRARAAAGVADVAASPHDDPLAADVHLALRRGEVTIRFQPQATMAGAVTGVEALARWEHPTRGRLGAEALFAAAERAGIAVALSEHVQRRVLDEVAGWSGARAALRVALNLTAADLGRPGFVDTLLAHVDASGVHRERLTLEVTETELMTDLDAAAAVLAGIQAAGCRTAIDDFGTGYSSLAYLASLPIDYLKLDRALAQEVTGSSRGQVVVRAAIDMALSLGIDVVAEGVEDEAQRAALATAGCTSYQGFLLAPPLDGAELARLLEER